MKYKERIKEGIYTTIFLLCGLWLMIIIGTLIYEDYLINWSLVWKSNVFAVIIGILSIPDRKTNMLTGQQKKNE